MPLHALGQFVHEGVVSLMLAAVGGILMWPYNKAKQAYRALMDTMKATQAELTLQRQNCLDTLQRQGESQVNLLTKACDTLDGVRLDLKEQTGFLQGLTSPRRASARAKK